MFGGIICIAIEVELIDYRLVKEYKGIEQFLCTRA